MSLLTFISELFWTMASNIHSLFTKTGTQEAAASTSPFTRESCASAPFGRPLVSIITYATNKGVEKLNKTLLFTVTHQSSSPTWLKRVSRKRVRLADVQLYVFSQQYRQQTQRKGTGGSFELQFYSEEGKPIIYLHVYRVLGF